MTRSIPSLIWSFLVAFSSSSFAMALLLLSVLTLWVKVFFWNSVYDYAVFALMFCQPFISSFPIHGFKFLDVLGVFALYPVDPVAVLVHSLYDLWHVIPVLLVDSLLNVSDDLFVCQVFK